MIGLFQLSSADQSLSYLAQIFGRVGAVLTPATYSALLGNMFRVFNTAVLTLGAVLVVYVTVVGLLKTAQEGEFLGKQWNSLWVPVRTVLGIAALFPTSSGYSAIQVVMMWIIIQGIGAADTLWTSVINYTKAIGGSPLSTVTIPSTNVTSTMNTLFKGLVCQASARGPSTGNQGDIIGSQRTPSGGKTAILYYCNSPNHKDEGFCQGQTADMLDMLGPQSNRVNSYSMGPGVSNGIYGACGTLTFCNATGSGDCRIQNSKECLACKAQHNALQAILPLLGQIAQTLVDSDYNYALFYEQPFANPLQLPSNSIFLGIPGLISEYSGPQIIFPTPGWVANYCSAQTPPIPPEQCCSGYGVPNQSCTGIQNFYALAGDKDGTNLDNNTIKSLYLAYLLKPQLGANIDFMSTAVDQYMGNVLGAVNDYIKQQILNPPVRGGDEWEWTENAINQGWILAGTYYYYMSKLNKASLDAANPAFSMDSTDPKLNQENTRMKIYRNNYTAASALFEGISNEAQQQGAPSYGAPAQFQAVTTHLGAAQSGLLHTFMTNLSEGDNPAGAAATRGAPMATNAVARISTFGYSLMITAQLLFAVIIAAAFLMGMFGSLNFIVLGTGLTLNPLYQGIQAMLSVVSPFIILMLTAIYSLGATLGIYVPLIPFVVFTVSAIGWFIGVIEAMVAAPIVALGILSPGGQHDILGRAEPALMTVLNTFLRPTLMIFGLMIAMILSNVVVNLINAGFLAATHQIMTAPGLFETILFISAYVSLIITALNKAFSIIYMLPERVLTWIGGHAVQYGEGEALGTMQRAVEGAAGASAGAGKESGGAAVGGAMEHQKTTAESKKKEGDTSVRGQGIGDLKGGGATPSVGGT